MKIVCCNQIICCGEVWFLEDVKGFTARKIFIAKCPICDEELVTLFETRIEDKKVFINKFRGIDAIKTIYREKKRKFTVFPNIKSASLQGWVYGKNIEIKNKKGKITKIRQYACDYKTNERVLCKVVPVQ